MENQYISELFQKLESTEIRIGQEYITDSYTEGIERLVNVFTEHKENQSRLFFIGNGGISRS